MHHIVRSYESGKKLQAYVFGIISPNPERHLIDKALVARGACGFAVLRRISRVDMGHFVVPLAVACTRLRVPLFDGSRLSNTGKMRLKPGRLAPPTERVLILFLAQSSRLREFIRPSTN